MKILKLKPLIEGFVPSSVANAQVPQETEKEWTLEEKKAALELIGRFNEYGAHLRREHNLMEIAHALSKITEAAEKFAIREVTEASEDGWFDANTVKKNMDQLKKSSGEFSKLAKEAHTIQQRMEALFEDCGHLVSRYYEVNEVTEGVEPAKSKIEKQM